VTEPSNLGFVQLGSCAPGGEPLGRQSVRVVFMPDSREVWVVSGSTIYDALLAASIPISMPCGGHGRCGRCLVRVRGGVSKPSEAELRLLGPDPSDFRLACMAKLEGNAEVIIPDASRIAVQKARTSGKVSGRYEFDPGIVKVYLGEWRSSQTWLKLGKYGLGMEDVTISMVNRDLVDAHLQEDHQWQLGLHSNATAVASPEGVIGFEAGNTAADCYGIAVDIGTNTVICSIVNLINGREVGVTSAINPQVIHGDDIVSRIRFSKNPGGLRLLRDEIVHLIKGLAGELVKQLDVDLDRVYLCSAVGNTAMQHIFLGVSPVDLGRAPYRSKLTSAIDVPAQQVGLPGHHRCRLIMPPPIGGFVGSDIVALIISQALHRRRVPMVAIDIGTNGEIVMAAGGKILACSTAAGPAFEGERISSGVRAVQGAIEDVRITSGIVKLKVIGGGVPVGLCGSGLIAAIAELLRVRVIEASGRIKPASEIRDRRLASRVVENERGREFIVCKEPMISIKQGDIREVQLGKAAICAGVKVLTSVAGLQSSQIRLALIAGSFGSSLRAACFRRLGFLPEDLNGRISSIGNSAIEGAKILLTSRQARRIAEQIAERCEHVELFSHPTFKDEFYRSIAFPA